MESRTVNTIKLKYIDDPRLNSLTAPEKSLFRPVVSVRNMVSAILLFSVVTFLESALLEWISFSDGVKYDLRFGVVAAIIIFINLLIVSKSVLIQCILIYQRYGNPSVRLRCCFEPSCSQYAILALRKYGTVIALFKIISRLKRCHPPGGIDYP